MKHGEVTLTNRGWHVSEQKLQQNFSFEDVRLINDFTAMARAVPEFDRASFEKILPGTPEPEAPVIVAGAGTGKEIIDWALPASHPPTLDYPERDILAELFTPEEKQDVL